MTSTVAPSRHSRFVGGASGAVAVLVAVVVPYLVALLLWIVAAPRSEVMSVGEGRGLRLPDAGADGGTQLILLVILLGFSSVCAVLVLWRLRPRLRRPAGVVALGLIPGLACAVAAAAATPLAGVLAAPDREAAYGEVVLQAPAVGDLFFGRMVYGTSGPSWDVLPPGAGWFVWGALVALFTVAALAHFSSPADLGED